MIGLSPVLQDLLETSIHKGITKRAIIGREAVSITGVFRFDSSGSIFSSPFLSLHPSLSAGLLFPPLSSTSHILLHPSHHLQGRKLTISLGLRLP